MKILSSRYLMLEYLLAAYEKIKVPLIGFDGVSLIPFSGSAQNWTGSYDDIGIFILIPKLVHLFNLSLQQGIDLFFYGIKYSSFIIGFFGLMLLNKSLAARLISSLGILYLLRISVIATDVYIMYLAALLGIIPLFIYCIENLKNYSLVSFFVFLSSFVLITFHYIRSYSSLPVFAFMIIMIFCTSKLSYFKKCFLLALMFIGGMIPWCYFTHAKNQYQEYAHQHFKDMYDFPTKHPFWHSIYAGFGLLQWMNNDQIAFSDDMVFKKVEQKAPGVTFLQMDEYEKCVKQEVIDLCKNQTFFVLVTLFAKLGILFFYLLKLANFGLLAAFIRPKPWYVELSFAACFGCSALFPLMTIPQGNYTLSFLTLSVLYGVISANYYLEQTEVSIMTRLKNLFIKSYAT